MKNNHKGFTIIELLIATMVFSTILLLFTVGLINVSRMYYKGAVMSRTQDAARAIADEISQNIQFSGGTVANLPGAPPDIAASQLCIGQNQYSYLLGKQLKNTAGAHAIVIDTNVPNCASSTPQDVTQPAPTITTSSRELLAPAMRLSRLEVNPLSSNLYEVIVRIVYGNDDVLVDAQKSDGTPGTDNIKDTCINESSSSQFCAVSELKTTVQKRVNVD